MKWLFDKTRRGYVITGNVVVADDARASAGRKVKMMAEECILRDGAGGLAISKLWRNKTRARGGAQESGGAGRFVDGTRCCSFPNVVMQVQAKRRRRKGK